MPPAVDSPYLVPFAGGFRVADAATAPPAETSREASEKRLKRLRRRLDELQRRLYAGDRWAVLVVFQALDAAGKDGTIRAVFHRVDPAGCRVWSFKAPSAEELDHDFLWRTTRRLPERGTIAVFNRSYYEEVLIARVRPELLDAQKLPRRPPPEELWEERFRSIREHEEHLARNGTLVVKVWLHVSREEQRRRFLSRLDEPEKHWKFSARDVEESDRFDDYLAAYEAALNATSRPWAPWYAVPADDKAYLRATVADLVVRNLDTLDLAYPEPADADRARFAQMRDRLLTEAGRGAPSHATRRGR